MSSEQALSIASLVAFAVEDLDPEHVKITDKDGRVYAIEDELQGSINSQMGFKVENENQLARKAQMQLNRLVGYGNASVQVSLDLTFTHGSKKVVKYDPDGKVAEQGRYQYGKNKPGPGRGWRCRRCCRKPGKSEPGRRQNAEELYGILENQLPGPENGRDRNQFDSRAQFHDRFGDRQFGRGRNQG